MKPVKFFLFTKNLSKFILILLYLATQRVTYAQEVSQELTPEQIYEVVNPSVVVVLVYDSKNQLVSQGSGVVFDDRGYVVTNYHVFGEGSHLEIKHYDKTIKEIQIIGIDVQKDILILKIPANILPSIKIADASKLKPGQRIYAIGSPFGLENSITEGIISGLRYFDDLGRDFIQISAAISPGSSGGAVVNSYGKLIGISTISLEGGQNLNFAINVKDFQSITTFTITEEEIQINNLFYKGLKANENGNYSDAVEYFTNYLKKMPNDADAYNNRGIAYSDLRDYSKAISDFTKAIEINPDFALAYNNRGTAYSDLKDYSKAISDYTKAIKINPNDADAYYNRGIAYGHLKDYSKAISDFTKAIEINPNDAEAYYNRGIAYADLQNYSKAISDYTKAIEINPDYAKAFYNRGIAYSDLQNYSKAISDYTKAIEINPNFAGAYYNRGYVYSMRGDCYNAKKDWEKAIELNPTYESELRTYINRCK